MSGKADGQTTPGLLEGDVEAWSARWRPILPSATVCSEDDVRHTFAGSQRGRHRWRYGSLILWLQPPRQSGNGSFYTMGRFRTSASEGRLPPGQCVTSGWTGLFSLFFDSNADSNETGRFKWPLVPTKCLNRKRAKYPPFPASHYGRLFRPLYRGIRGGLPLLGLLSLCPLCRRFTRRVVWVCPPSRLPAGCCSCRI